MDWVLRGLGRLSHAGAVSLHSPNVIERPLYFVHEGNHGIEQKGESDGTQNAHSNVFHKTDDVFAKFRPLSP